MSRNIKTFFLIGVASLALSMISDKSDTRIRHPSAGLAGDRVLEHLNTKQDAMDTCYNHWNGLGYNHCSGVSQVYDKGDDNGHSAAKSYND
jgi:hypothetical protein